MLADHIISVNSKLLQQALQSIGMSSKRWNTTEQINELRARLPEGTLNISQDCLNPNAEEDKVGENFCFLQQGWNLISQGKVSLCLVFNNGENQQRDGENDVTDPVSYLYELLRDEQQFLQALSPPVI
ncbi:PREDICTED: uncharacterized protein LOC104798460 [Tarenaya hassleriana]|uniref:uncharacterized protein LOC104798460 n=1 Tax=Tarenaya hassleriana TaxID=28532 RepID=UPI00053C33CB|nr:PREDICTED: uncharacterized protein LOC104798460 [Tarenaya hassleriana]